MHSYRRNQLRFVLVVALLLAVLTSGCSVLWPTQVSPARSDTSNQDVSPEGETTPEPGARKAAAPATWTPTATSELDFPPTRTPFPTPNYAETRTALTVIAEGISCKRAPDSWRVFVSPAIGIAGWCSVAGTEGTIYEYKLTAPDGWTVTTFGGIYPNLAFTTGYKNVSVRLYQSYSYHTRSYTGTLEAAPEKAFYCEQEDRCLGYLSPLETLVRQEMTTSGARDILVLDSTAGDMMIRRYYQMVPFKTRYQEGPRLFILELRWLKTALDDDAYAGVLEKIDLINRSLWQRE